MRHFSGAAVWFYLPWCVLALLLLTSAVSWRRQSVLLLQSLEQAVGDPKRASLVSMELQDAKPTGEQSSGQLARVMDAHDVLAVTYGFAFDSPLGNTANDVLVPRGEDWEAAELMRLYAEDARPLVDGLLEMVAKDASTWRPDSLQWRWYGAGFEPHYDWVAIMLSRVFADAFHTGDSQRAMQIIKLFDAIFPVDDPSSLNIVQITDIAGQQRMHDWIRRSLEDSFWSEAELEELMQVLSTDGEWNEKWKRILKREFVRALHVESQPERRHRYGVSPKWRKIAPSSRQNSVQWLEALLKLDPITNAGGWNELWETQRWIQPRPSMEAFDVLLQRPNLVCDPVPDSFLQPLDLVQRLALAVEDRRFTRCAVAISLFQKRFQRWPTSLDELSEVGVAAEDTFYFHGVRFFYNADIEPPTLAVEPYGLNAMFFGERKSTLIEFGS